LKVYGKRDIAIINAISVGTVKSVGIITMHNSSMKSLFEFFMLYPVIGRLIPFEW